MLAFIKSKLDTGEPWHLDDYTDLAAELPCHPEKDGSNIVRVLSEYMLRTTSPLDENASTKVASLKCLAKPKVRHWDKYPELVLIALSNMLEPASATFDTSLLLLRRLPWYMAPDAGTIFDGLPLTPTRERFMELVKARRWQAAVCVDDVVREGREFKGLLKEVRVELKGSATEVRAALDIFKPSESVFGEGDDLPLMLRMMEFALVLNAENKDSMRRVASAPWWGHVPSPIKSVSPTESLSLTSKKKKQEDIKVHNIPFKSVADTQPHMFRPWFAYTKMHPVAAKDFAGGDVYELGRDKSVATKSGFIVSGPFEPDAPELTRAFHKSTIVDKCGVRAPRIRVVVLEDKFYLQSFPHGVEDTVEDGVKWVVVSEILGSPCHMYSHGLMHESPINMKVITDFISSNSEVKDFLSSCVRHMPTRKDVIQSLCKE